MPSCVGSIEQRDAALRRLHRRTQGRQKIVQLQHRAAGRQAHHVAALIDFPAFAGTGQHDVFFLGIDEHVANPLQAAEIFDFVGQRLIDSSRTRQSPLRGRGAKSSASRRAPSVPPGVLPIAADRSLANSPKASSLRVVQQAVGVDRHAAHRPLDAGVDDLGVKISAWMSTRKRHSAEAMRKQPNRIRNENKVDITKALTVIGVMVGGSLDCYVGDASTKCSQPSLMARTIDKLRQFYTLFSRYSLIPTC